MPGLTVTTRFADSVAVLELAGEARREVVSELERAANEALATEGIRHLFLDLGRLEFMDSASAGVLLRIHAAVKATSGRCMLYGMRSVVQRLFDAMGLDDHLEVATDESAARARLL